MLRVAFSISVALNLMVTAHAQVDHLRFNVYHGKKVVGEVQAHRTVTSSRTHYLMTSDSEFWLLWKQDVRSYAETEYASGKLVSCYTSFHLNGDLRDSSFMDLNSDKYRCYVDPNERFEHAASVEWTTARMYFEEPIGRNTIYVESALRYRPLEQVAEHSYRLELPDGKVNTYTYERGELQRIDVERRFVDLVFKRT